MAGQAGSFTVRHYTEFGGQPAAREREYCLLEPTDAGPPPENELPRRPGAPDPASICALLRLCPSTHRLGELRVAFSKPRRLDVRIVSRRPMMLVKRRLISLLPRRRVQGREITARD